MSVCVCVGGVVSGSLKSPEDGRGQKKRSHCPETSRPNQDGVVNDSGSSRGLGDNLGQAQLSNCSLLAAEASPHPSPLRAHIHLGNERVTKFGVWQHRKLLHLFHQPSPGLSPSPAERPVRAREWIRPNWVRAVLL